MPKQKSEDYKLSAVQYYLEHDVSYAKTCEIFKCSERSLKRQIDRYLLENSIKRHNRLPVSYKIKKKHVKYAIKKLKENEQITMSELAKIVKKKYNDFDITPRQLRENSARNIYKIAKNAISKKERPNYLSRSKKVISGTSSVGKLQCHLLEKSNKATQSKFTRLETVKLC